MKPTSEESMEVQAASAKRQRADDSATTTGTPSITIEMVYELLLEHIKESKRQFNILHQKADQNTAILTSHDDRITRHDQEIQEIKVTMATITTQLAKIMTHLNIQP